YEGLYSNRPPPARETSDVRGRGFLFDRSREGRSPRICPGALSSGIGALLRGDGEVLLRIHASWPLRRALAVGLTAVSALWAASASAAEGLLDNLRQYSTQRIEVLGAPGEVRF